MTHAHAAHAAVSAAALSAPQRARTGGPGDDDGRERLAEQVLGWGLALLVAVLATRLGLV